MGSPKTSQYYQLIKTYGQRIGLNVRTFSPHNLRSGFVTQADLSGAIIGMIQRTTDHCFTAMVRTYIRNPDQVLKNHAGQRF
jgi:integrase